jgi:hypothetical protein
VSDGFFVLMATWASRTVSFADVMEVFVERCMSGDELRDDAGVFAR